MTNSKPETSIQAQFTATLPLVGFYMTIRPVHEANYMHCIHTYSIEIVCTISDLHTREQSGAAEVCWAHNPEVDGSKLSSAISFGKTFILDFSSYSSQQKSAILAISGSGLIDGRFQISLCLYGNVASNATTANNDQAI